MIFATFRFFIFISFHIVKCKQLDFNGNDVLSLSSCRLQIKAQMERIFAEKLNNRTYV